MMVPDVVLTIVLTTLLILLLIAGTTISFFIVSRQRSKREVELALTRLTYEKELRRVEVEVSEDMMRHFSQELHDNIGQLLTCLRLDMENRKLDNPSLQPEFAQMEKYLDESVMQLQLLSRSLNTDYVAQLGLINAIHLEVERQRQLKKLDVYWAAPTGELSLDRNEELMLFRIIQEIIHNSLKHSHAKNLKIEITNEPYFKLMISDDGRGFFVEDVLLSSKASGLHNIKRRASMAGMNCEINSLPGQGCQYLITKPHCK